MEPRSAANKRRLFELVFVFGAGVTLLFAVLFALLGQRWFGFVIGLVVAAVWVAIAWFKGDEVVLELCNAKPIDRKRHARLVNVTEGLCAAMGLTPPKLYMVDDKALNALAVGRDGHHASVAITRGLYEESSLVELEAAMALQLFKIRNDEIVIGTVAIPTIGASWVLSERYDNVEWLRRILAAPAKLVQRALVAVHPGTDELDTDIAAVQITRYPPGLAALLDKMAGRSALASAAPVTASLWMAPPVPPAVVSADLRRLHMPLEQRVAVLQEL